MNRGSSELIKKIKSDPHREYFGAGEVVLTVQPVPDEKDPEKKVPGIHFRCTRYRLNDKIEVYLEGDITGFDGDIPGDDAKYMCALKTAYEIQKDLMYRKDMTVFPWVVLRAKVGREVREYYNARVPDLGIHGGQ